MYHVQLRMTEEKAEAERALGQALSWWNDADAKALPQPAAAGQSSPVTIAYRTPLYRVRLGPFASRAAADSVLSAAHERFPDAFVAPSRRSAARP